MRQIGYVGKSRLEAAQRLLPGALSSWRSQWCFDGRNSASASAATLPAETADDISSIATHWQQAATPNGVLWLGSRASSNWQDLVFGEQAQDVPADQIAEHLIRQAQLALANALLDALQQRQVDTMAAAIATPVAACSPCLLLTVPGHEADIFIVLDASLLDAYLPIPAARIPLLDRKQAIGGASIKLKLMLPLAEISVADLGDIYPGDILKATTPLSQPFHLTTDQDAVVAKGFLVRAHSRLAVQLADC
ncbi:MAG: hypothetical protein AABY68_05655 [Pseudomonadota bacterium]